MKIITFIVLFLFSIPSKIIWGQDSGIARDSAWAMDAFIDSLVETKMEEMHVPGAVVTIVQKGQIVFNSGYGYADIENKRAIDPKRSAFRLASISKPFTAIAIMKLVEEGKLKLHEDIRPLIADRYEFDWKYPLTIHQILTHTTGIDYSSIGSHKTEGKNYNPNEKMPLLGQGHKPGDHFAYSNIAFGLLGHLIEKKSGLPYHQYMQQHILEPLQMNNSTFNTTLPHEINMHKAETYYWSEGQYHKQPRQHLGIPAASSLESTGGDMAIFMKALLNPLIFENLGIISEESFHKMTSPQLPEITTNTVGYSFLISNIRNNKSIYHSGGVRGFLSIYNVFPAQDFGVFIAQNNRKGAESFAWSLNSKLFEKLLPITIADLSWVKNQKDRSIDIQSFRGIYRQPRHRNSTFEKAQSLMINNEVEVKIVNDTTLSMFGKEFRRIANTTFLESSENSERIQQFRANDNGTIERFVNGTQTYKKLKWYQKNIYKQVIVGSALLYFLIGLIISIRNYFSKSKNKVHIYQKWILLIGSGYLLSFSALLTAYFVVETVKEGVPLGFKTPIVLLTICGLLSLAFPWAIYKNANSTLSLKAKTWNYIGIAAILIISIIFYDLNLIGLKW